MGGDARRRSVGDRVIPIPGELRSRLVANGMRTRVGEAHDPYPVVRLFTPDAAASWLLTELEPDDPDLAYGLCDLGLGAPKLAHVRLSLPSEVAGELGSASCRESIWPVVVIPGVPRTLK